MNAGPRRSFVDVSSCAPVEVTPPNAEQSSRKLSGQKSPFDPEAFYRMFPDRWMAFLHAHHRSVIEVAAFYSISEKAAAKWWNGIGGPRGDKVVLAAVTHPEGFKKYLVDAA